jgi:hypothetical protein
MRWLIFLVAVMVCGCTTGHPENTKWDSDPPAADGAHFHRTPNTRSAPPILDDGSAEYEDEMNAKASQ